MVSFGPDYFFHLNLNIFNKLPCFLYHFAFFSSVWFSSIGDKAGLEGLEPPATGFGDRCSSQLSYRPVPIDDLPRLFMNCMLIAETTILFEFHPLGMQSLIFCRSIISLLTFCTFKRDYIAHFTAPLFNNSSYSIISVTTPAPTVRPPSRIAKRSSFSIAISFSSSTVITILSPGITLSTPSGIRMLPVTSVVRK